MIFYGLFDSNHPFNRLEPVGTSFGVKTPMHFTLLCSAVNFLLLNVKRVNM